VNVEVVNVDVNLQKTSGKKEQGMWADVHWLELTNNTTDVHQSVLTNNTTNVHWLESTNKTTKCRWEECEEEK
jgi:hypothetical protein